MSKQWISQVIVAEVAQATFPLSCSQKHVALSLIDTPFGTSDLPTSQQVIMQG